MVYNIYIKIAVRRLWLKVFWRLTGRGDSQENRKPNHPFKLDGTGGVWKIDYFFLFVSLPVYRAL